MCQNEDENEDENQRFNFFLEIMRDEQTNLLMYAARRNENFRFRLGTRTAYYCLGVYHILFVYRILSLIVKTYTFRS